MAKQKLATDEIDSEKNQISQTFMEGVFEEHSVDSLLEHVVDEENVFLRCLSEDDTVVVGRGVRIVDSDYLKNQATASKRAMSLKKVLGPEYAHLLPSDTKIKKNSSTLQNV